MKHSTLDNTQLNNTEHCARYQQKGSILWFTGLSGAGKTTLATLLEKELLDAGKIVCLLDGDLLREGLNSDLSFDEASRQENIRRIAELALYLSKQAFIVLVSAISPHRSLRQFARKKAVSNGIVFYEIYVKASLKICEQRDPKGLYKKVKTKKIKDFTGIDTVYEPPLSPELILDTEQMKLAACLNSLKALFFKNN
ncbi:MAG: adenylyl-sulfate kinase [Gammaproteobacteria bacterium RIFCSPHIGHO2_12_FULL_35_23]|nr:MAG: adenylyl-sulfate kinase [Gammaproteobacteria bacterium RIFCSPHIGHO2_12_FULL_35_23]